MRPEFGEGIDVIEPLRLLLKNSPTLPATDARLVLLETYENTFRIYDHLNGDPARQMANVAMHQAENVLDGGLLDERMEEFVERQVGKYFNISFDAFMNLEPHICRKMMEIAAKHMKEEGTMGQKVLEQMNQLQSGKGV